MKKTGAWLVRFALEQLGVRHTFGIPGVHNTELYDELAASESLHPILVTHEGCGAFMADAISRTSQQVGTLVLVPAAGLTHAASGIGEAFLDGVPMLVISGGIRSDSAYQFQLHDIDNHAFIGPLCKATFKISRHAEIVETFYRAFDLACSGEPGPVYIEVPVNLQLDKGEILDLPAYAKQAAVNPVDRQHIHKAAELLKAAKRPGLFLGWGAVDAQDSAIAIAERLGAPVATTLQGLSAFPGDHPLSVGMSFGPHAVPAAKIMESCDVLLAVGTRFSEIATGSFGMPVPSTLIHIDINPRVFHVNYPATVTVQGDSREILPLLLEQLVHMGGTPSAHVVSVRDTIEQGRQQFRKSWEEHATPAGKVSPAAFFSGLKEQMTSDTYVVADDGNHTFLTAEHLPIRKPRHFISPTDFNCMGYAVPAALGVKLMHPESPVVAIVGDGAFNMTCMELLTAVRERLGVVIAVFADGELAQIAQAQQIPYRRMTCTELPRLDRRALAQALGLHYIALSHDTAVGAALQEAWERSQTGQPVLLDVAIDYSRPTYFTQGILKTNLKRLNRGTQVRMVGRALWRRVTMR
ncbi:MAG: thiamine pyrophosphate-binding protein [Pseudomonadales bacterium]|nr:thiamine pyrophosphate-binding protein [Pseudomonadales bacterium]